MNDASIPVVRADGTMATLDEIRSATIDHALLVCRSRRAAATALGIGRSTLYKKLGRGTGASGSER